MDRLQGHWSNNTIESLRYILEMIEHLPGLNIKALLDKVAVSYTHLTLPTKA